MHKKVQGKIVHKKAIVGIALGVIMLTSVVGAVSLHTDTNKTIDLERKREQKLNLIDNASLSWRQGIIDDEKFIEVIEQAVTDTDLLRGEYELLNLPPKYDKYKSLSLDSLNKQKEAFLKLKEYVQTEDPTARESIQSEFDQLMITSFDDRREALKELES